MAKFIGYSERLAFDYYDCFSPRDLGDPSADKRIKLFVGHAAERSSTVVVRDWYARTNLSGLPGSDHARSQWHAWASITTVSLVVGCMPVLTMPLGNLFARHLKAPEKLTQASCEASTAELADQLRFAHSPELQEGEPNLWPITEARTNVSNEEREKWLHVSREAQRLLNAPAYARIPERQNYEVVVSTDERALAAMLEVMPGNVAPRVLVWIHLAGFTITDVMYDGPNVIGGPYR